MSSASDLSIAWMAEGNFMQWLVFSVVLVSLAMSFRHVARARANMLPKHVVSALSLYVAVIAVIFGIMAVLTYVSRVRQLVPANPSEVSTQIALSILGLLLLGAECAVTVTMWLT